MWLHFREERFTTNQNTKLMPRGDVPFQVLERLNSNVNKINLPPEYQVHNTFNVWDLSLFSTLHDDDPSNLRINYSEKKERMMQFELHQCRLLKVKMETFREFTVCS